jgi:gas vesicle protein
MKYFSALLVGAVAGGVAGLLLAPAKGEKTRKRLNKQAEKARKEMDELVKIGRNTYEDIRKLS